MSTIKEKNTDKKNTIEDYLTAIPRNLWDILIPDKSDDFSDFSSKIHKLRIWEVERNYVMELQHNFKITIRPNESVKATMIRARLKILKERLKHTKDSRYKSTFKNLPVDPLE